MLVFGVLALLMAFVSVDLSFIICWTPLLLGICILDSLEDENLKKKVKVFCLTSYSWKINTLVRFSRVVDGWAFLLTVFDLQLARHRAFSDMIEEFLLHPSFRGQKSSSECWGCALSGVWKRNNKIYRGIERDTLLVFGWSLVNCNVFP